MLSLLAKLGLDISLFRRGLDGAKASAAEASKTIGQSLGSELKKYLGAAAAFGFVARQFDRIGEAANRAALNSSSIGEELAKSAVLARIGDSSAVAADELQRLVDLERANLPSEGTLKTIADDALLVKANLTEAENALVSLMATTLRAGSTFSKAFAANNDAMREFVVTLNESKKGEVIGNLRRAFDNSGKAFRNRFMTEVEAERAIVEQRKPVPAPKPVAPADAAAKPGPRVVPPKDAQLFLRGDQRPEVGALASAGLFFGGTGNPLIREVKTQTDIARQSLVELQRVRNAIREEL